MGWTAADLVAPAKADSARMKARRAARLSAHEEELLAVWRKVSEQDRAHLFGLLRRVAEATVPSEWLRNGEYVGPERRRA
jgi:hypothetical protein